MVFKIRYNYNFSVQRVVRTIQSVLSAARGGCYKKAWYFWYFWYSYIYIYIREQSYKKEKAPWLQALRFFITCSSIALAYTAFEIPNLGGTLVSRGIFGIPI